MVGDAATDLVKVAEKCRSQTVSMTKADLTTMIADKLRFPWARAELLVDVVFGCLEQSMSRGEKIEIRATRTNYPYTQCQSSSCYCAHSPIPMCTSPSPSRRCRPQIGTARQVATIARLFEQRCGPSEVLRHPGAVPVPHSEAGAGRQVSVVASLEQSSALAGLPFEPNLRQPNVFLGFRIVHYVLLVRLYRVGLPRPPPGVGGGVVDANREVGGAGGKVLPVLMTGDSPSSVNRGTNHLGRLLMPEVQCYVEWRIPVFVLKARIGTRTKQKRDYVGTVDAEVFASRMVERRGAG